MELLKRIFRRSASNKHLSKPQQPQLTPEQEEMLKEKIRKLQESPYQQYILPLKDKVLGKTVVKTTAGTSGFIIIFSDNTWVISYLKNSQLDWQFGQDELKDNLHELINSKIYGNGYEPLSIDRMYANEICNIEKEIANAQGKKIQGIAIGENCFNFCFPKKMELNTTISPTTTGKYALRVFWEQY